MANKTRQKTTTIILSILISLTLLMILPMATVYADDNEGPGQGDPKEKYEQSETSKKEAKETAEDATDEEIDLISGTGVHKDPTVFEKNFCLTPAQKKQAITTIEDAVSKYAKPGMSDLEKYYMLALYENYSVKYDSNFWPGGYDFDYYKHQWDAYGILNEHLGVCAGIAVTYANLCHAAGLPCKFVRCDPAYLDHTINHIPDINGHSYYIDVTENSFFMSQYCAWSFEPIDLGFSDIKEEDRPGDGSFEYYSEYAYGDDEAAKLPANIKEFYSGKIYDGDFEWVDYETWYKEYALHENQAKKFVDTYVENGSGDGTTHAQYADFDNYPAQPYASRVNLGDGAAVTGIWFLDDFYLEPTTIKNKIKRKKFDEQLLIIEGLKGSYDCDESKSTEEIKTELEEAVSSNISSINYFPSLDENDEVVAEAAPLKKGTDYEVKCKEYDAEKHEATIAIRGLGEYSGADQDNEALITVKVNSALVTKAPIRERVDGYDGNPHKLIDSENKGTAVNGTMVYAKGTKDGPTEEFSTDIPTATNAGIYYIWYKAKGDESYHDSEPQRIKQPVVIDLVEIWIYVQDDITIAVGETVKLTPEIDREMEVTFSFESGDEDVVTVSKDGTITGVAEGSTTVMIYGKLKNADPNIADPQTWVMVTVIPKEAKKNNISKASVSGIKAKTWTGKALKQKPTVKVSGKTLKNGTDYTVTYKNNKNVGKATLTITGKGNYTGKIKKTFKINPKGTRLFRVTKAKKAARVKWKKQTAKMSASRITGYQIQLATNSKFTRNKKTVNRKGWSKTSKKVTGLKSGKKYYVRVRTYKTVRGVRYYSAWSKVKTVKIR